MNNEYFYYMRDQEGRPRITVCLISEEGVLCRGLSLCSHLDAPKIKTGRNKAKGRAVKALVRKQASLPVVRKESFDVLIDVKVTMTSFEKHFQFKSWYDAKPTGFEKKLLEGNNRNEKRAVDKVNQVGV